MWTRKHTPRNRGFRPEAVILEGRQLLSAVVSGTDSKGDTWSLRLIGPGSISVVKQDLPGTTTPGSLTSATDINTITVGGTNPLTSRLVGTVTPGPESDGRVFFQTFNQLATRSALYTGSGDGLLSIDMPGFWLGNTTPSGTVPSAAPIITIPDGVDTLDFGGVDTSVNQPPAASATSDTALVSLGLPVFGGTRIIINKSISSTESVPPASGSTTTTPTIVQHGVEFAVSGRLDLFQANEIDGDATNPPGQFLPSSTTATTAAGGTIVFSSTPGFGTDFPFTTGLFPSAETKGAVTGQIGDVRVGGNATNFSTYVFDATGSGGDKIANFSVGGETDNVQVIAPTGLRNVFFGKGMDTVDINAHVINRLQANRGALNSTVTADRSISRVDLGGDVVNTTVLAGYQQNYVTILTDVVGLSGSAQLPPTPLNAQAFGGMTLHVAGSVTNSVFAASVEPFQNNYGKGNFGNPNQLVLTGGRINSKIEGTITNTVATPNTPNQAIYAAKVVALTGPVVPPNVPEEPYTGPAQPTHAPGIAHPSNPLVKTATTSTATTTTATTPTTTPVDTTPTTTSTTDTTTASSTTTSG